MPALVWGSWPKHITAASQPSAIHTVDLADSSLREGRVGGREDSDSS
jgi:hypothetical protein